MFALFYFHLHSSLSLGGHSFDIKNLTVNRQLSRSAVTYSSHTLRRTNVKSLIFSSQISYLETTVIQCRNASTATAHLAQRRHRQWQQLAVFLPADMRFWITPRWFAREQRQLADTGLHIGRFLSEIISQNCKRQKQSDF